jgi:2-polyprenyl-3-methyl-5-hydroxy-6-metoxy-1,4-benzoquinol methylase
MSLKALSMTYTSRIVNAKASIRQGGVVLHLGCGDGYLDPYLCTRFSRVVGVDINFPELQNAAAGSGVETAEYVLTDGLVLPFESEMFDAIVSIDVMEHAEDDVALMREMSRVLKPGGLLTMTVPNAEYPFTFDPVNYVLKVAGGRHLPFGMWGFGHRRLYTVESLSNLLTRVGLEVQEARGMSYSLVALIENSYLLNLAQPFTKSSASNLALGVEAESGGTWRKVAAIEPPEVLQALRDLVIKLDRALFDGASRCINLLIVARKD